MLNLKVNKRSIIGVSLLETLLALAIASSILVLSIRMYVGFRNQQDLRQIQTNVDTLFLAASLYYQTNCFGQGPVDSVTGKPTTVGKLNPLAAAAPGANVPLTITTDLQTPGYLEKWPLTTVALLDNTTLTNTYIVQFNKVTPTSKIWSNQCIVTPPATSCTAASQASATLPSAKKIVGWTIQVSVLIKDATKVAAFKSALGATCRSAKVGTIVTPCLTSLNTGSYLVWERLPSMASPSALSLLSPSIPRLKQNMLQYTHDQLYELGDITGVSNQYYLCGG